MKKLDLGQMISILANVGVIAGIIFLAYELRQNTVTARSQAAQALQNQIATNLELTTDAALADIFLRGNEDPSMLSPQELVQYASYMTSTFSAFENIHFQVSEGNFDEKRADGWWQLLRNLLSYAGVGAHWESRQFLYSQEFVEFVNQDVMALQPSSGWELGSYPQH